MKVEVALLLLAASAAAVSAYRVWSGDECRRYCGYHTSYVCSTGEVTYDNECMLKCDRAYKQCDGRCPCYRPPRPIYYEPRPVEPQEPVYVYNEPLPQNDCRCSPDKDYVCTYDGETYDNECEANCDGKVKMCDGQCPCT
ncbi:insoluble matrix shell protein 6-like [Mercenaria mercenaria]|uniref:insoluble matrix shell protein 6-like n=1 Tax=Mercenaria mercenaria TaxID=6596 RepID=UPI00234E7DFC|nr:insoluble matrix shell protein 6-like [Mercenaria mercenaria]